MKIQIDKGLLAFLFSVFLKYLPYYLGAFVGLGILHYIQSELPFLARELAQMADGKELSFSYSILIWFAAGIILFRTASRLLFFYPARMMQRDVRVEIIHRLEKTLPLRYLEKFDSGQVFQIVGADIDAIRGLVGFGLLQIGNIIIALSVLVPKLASFEPRLLIALTPLFVGFVFFTIIVAQNRKYYRLTQDYQGKINQFIIESYQGKETIQNYQSESIFFNLFQKTSYRELLNFYQAGKGIAFSLPLVPLGLGVSLLWGAIIVHNLDLGTSALVLFSGFIFLFLEPLMFLSWIGVVFARSVVSWKRFKELLNLMDTPHPMEEFVLTQAEKERFQVLFWDQPRDMDIKEKGLSALVGATGVGKSYLLKQLALIYRQKNRKVSYVAQSPYLYNDTVESNIFLGLDAKDRNLDLAKKLLKLFEMEVLSPDMDDLLKLEVGENGKRVSGGQAKRICLIRSLMSGADTLFWDDPFSSVDLLLERKIMDELNELGLLKGLTLVMTTHRLSTLKFCDEYFLLDKTLGISERGIVNQALTQKESKAYEHFKDQLAENLFV
jgi:ATP-binding cassette subfamily B multidrug efflux pump